MGGKEPEEELDKGLKEEPEGLARVLQEAAEALFHKSHRVARVAKAGQDR